MKIGKDLNLKTQLGRRLDKLGIPNVTGGLYYKKL